MDYFGTGILEKEVEKKTVIIDGKNATIDANVEHEEVYRGYDVDDEKIYTNPSKLLRDGATPSFSLVRFAKIKNFIDGVYAAVEKRVNEKGHRLSRPEFLSKLEQELDGNAKKYVSSAIKLDTQNNPAMSIPQGFYDWTEELRNAYRQIKILSHPPGFLTGHETDYSYQIQVMDKIQKTIRKSDLSEKTYELISKLYAKMTGTPEDKPCLFPSAMLPDQEFFKEYSNETQSDIEDGLGKALVEAIKKNRVNFVPDKNSGLYVRQMFEILPLVLKDTKEFEKYLVNKKYADVLEKEFISQWAATRHTHVGHTSYDDMMYGSCMPMEQPIVIVPELAVEPFSTSYDRMNASISFLEETIRTFLPEVLEKNRILNDGSSSSKKIGEEFEEVKRLLTGLSCISNDSIHLPYEQPKNINEAVKSASSWLKNISSDPDINRNVAIFVPIIRTTDGSRQVSYIDAGYKTIKVCASYKDKPNVKIKGEEETKKRAFSDFFIDNRFEFEEKKYAFPVLVHREVRVPYEKLINDRKLKELLSDSFSEKELDTVVKELEKR